MNDHLSETFSGCKTFERFVHKSDAASCHITLTACLFMLLNFGVLNLCSDLSSQPELQNVVLDCFSSSNEEVKSAASYALGMITRFFCIGKLI